MWQLNFIFTISLCTAFYSQILNLLHLLWTNISQAKLSKWTDIAHVLSCTVNNATFCWTFWNYFSSVLTRNRNNCSRSVTWKSKSMAMQHTVAITAHVHFYLSHSITAPHHQIAMATCSSKFVCCKCLSVCLLCGTEKGQKYLRWLAFIILVVQMTECT